MLAPYVKNLPYNYVSSDILGRNYENNANCTDDFYNIEKDHFPNIPSIPRYDDDSKVKVTTRI